MKLHPSKATVEVVIPNNEVVVNNKTAKDIQTGVQLSGDKITGTSNYVTDIENAGGEGNYFVIELPQAKDVENNVVCQFEGGSPTELSNTDYQYLIKVTESGKKPITITVTGKVEATRTLDISGLILKSKEN